MNLSIILGLASALTLTAAASANPNQNQYKLDCFGNEPFWSVQVRGNHVKFSTPNIANNFKSYWDARSIKADGVPADYGFQVRASRNRGAEKIVLSVVKDSKNSCLDSMSGYKYSHHVLVSLENGTLYKGCCKFIK
ncbi:MAG: hypothetical protein N3E45_13225 [Oscillatoriaceae bacterium SKW80]|nr:hypothetical protein [Oscillatoriaceae bacterium SKYG93]MCX8121761.1 hypothetical protein [Oscillatoriaceae bacterium SKW80]MDW8453622.1 hypothetical protein [Oscillatoriaceae cyanobacterium SKYGB_i_bin93]HIK28687.1 hypothetical protein [Oscillatoriaceae cyanobacterium M7585_C2015_266]